jgi:hypothetical protein
MMTRDPIEQMREALDRATTAMGVAGDAAALGNKKDAERALKEAGEEIARCRNLLSELRRD